MGRMRFGRFLPFASLVVLSAACSVSSEEEASGTGDAIVEQKVWAGPELASCSVGPRSGEGFYAARRVRCTANIPADFPLVIDGVLSVFDKNGTPKSTRLSELATTPLDVQIFEDKFPLTTKLDVSVRERTGERVVNLPQYAPLRTEGKLDLASASTFSAKLPFDVWPVTYVGHAVTFQGVVAAQPIDLGTMTSQNAATLNTERSSVLVQTGETKQLLYIVAPGSKLEGTGTFGQASLPFTVPAPGTYAAFADGLRAVSADAPLPVSNGPVFGGCTAQPAGAQPDGGQPEGAQLALQCSLFDGRDGITVTSGSVRFEKEGVSGTEVAFPSTLIRDAVAGRITPGDTTGAVVSTLTLALDVQGVPQHVTRDPLTLSIKVEDIVASKKNGYVLPFDVWPVSVSAAPDTIVLLTVPPHVVPMNTQWSGLSSFQTDEVSATVDEQSPKTFRLAADSNAPEIEATAVLI